MILNGRSTLATLNVFNLESVLAFEDPENTIVERADITITKSKTFEKFLK